MSNAASQTQTTASSMRSHQFHTQPANMVGNKASNSPFGQLLDATTSPEPPATSPHSPAPLRTSDRHDDSGTNSHPAAATAPANPPRPTDDAATAPQSSKQPVASTPTKFDMQSDTSPQSSTQLVASTLTKFDVQSDAPPTDAPAKDQDTAIKTDDPDSSAIASSAPQAVQVPAVPGIVASALGATVGSAGAGADPVVITGATATIPVSGAGPVGPATKTLPIAGKSDIGPQGKSAPESKGEQTTASDAGRQQTADAATTPANPSDVEKSMPGNDNHNDRRPGHHAAAPDAITTPTDRLMPPHNKGPHSDVTLVADNPTSAATAGGDTPQTIVLATQTVSETQSAFQTAASTTQEAPVAIPIAGLAVEIAARAQNGKNRFEIRLDPPELGRVDIRLDVDRQGNVTSRLTVERTEILDLLRREAPQLERALQDAGLKTGDNGMQFSLRDQGYAQNQNGRGDRVANAARIVVPDEDMAAVETTRSYSRLFGSISGIDIRV